MGYMAVGYGVGVGVYGGGAPLDWVGGTLYGVPAEVYPGGGQTDRGMLTFTEIVQG